MAASGAEDEVLRSDFSNFSAWQRSIMAKLHAKNLADCATSDGEPDAYREGQAMAIMRLALSREIFLEVINCMRPFELHKRLCRMCSEKRSWLGKYSLVSGLLAFKIGQADPAGSLDELRLVAARIRQLEVGLGDDLLTCIAWQKLPDELKTRKFGAWMQLPKEKQTMLELIRIVRESSPSKPSLAAKPKFLMQRPNCATNGVVAPNAANRLAASIGCSPSAKGNLSYSLGNLSTISRGSGWGDRRKYCCYCRNGGHMVDECPKLVRKQERERIGVNFNRTIDSKPT